MTTQKTAQIIAPEHSLKPSMAIKRLRTAWSGVAGLITVGIFFQAGLAGGMLSGFDFAYRAHTMMAGALTATTFVAALVALVSLRGIENGRKFGWTLLALGGAIFVQTVIGKLSTEGVNLLWVHVPLGVALVGLAVQASTSARKLGGGEAHEISPVIDRSIGTRKFWSI